MLDFFTDNRDQTEDSVSFACEYEIKLTYESSVSINDLDTLNTNTNKFSIIALRFLKPGEFNRDFDSYIIKRLGIEKFNSIKNNKNIWLMIFDIYDETKCITEFFPPITKQKNSLADRTILINSSKSTSNPYNLFKFKYTVPYWIKLLHIEFDKKIWNTSSFIDNHPLESKNKLMLCLMNNGRVSRKMFYTMIENNKHLMDQSLISFVSRGIRLDNDADTIKTMSSDRYQDSTWYQNTMFSVVFETSWYNDFFTEKIFKPILNEHPVFLLQKKSYIDYLNELGFDLTQEKYTVQNYSIDTDLMIDGKDFETKTQSMVSELYQTIVDYSLINYKELYSLLYSKHLVNIRKQNKNRLLDKSYCLNQFKKYSDSSIDIINKVYSESR